MNGTEKQIIWAEKIKQGLIDQVESDANKFENRKCNTDDKKKRAMGMAKAYRKALKTRGSARMNKAAATLRCSHKCRALDLTLDYLEHKLMELQHDFNLASQDSYTRLVLAVVMADYADVRDYILMFM
jgi:hypothetical protein